MVRGIFIYRQMISESEKEKALQTLRDYESQSKHVIRDSVEDDCPSQDYEPGEPNGECQSDGHYLCAGCIHFNKL